MIQQRCSPSMILIFTSIFVPILHQTVALAQDYQKLGTQNSRREKLQAIREIETRTVDTKFTEQRTLQATTVFHWNVLDGFWGVTNNWSPLGIPMKPIDHVVIDNGGIVRLDASYSYASTQILAGMLSLETPLAQLTSTDFSVGGGVLSATLLCIANTDLVGPLTLNQNGEIRIDIGRLEHSGGSFITSENSLVVVDGLTEELTLGGSSILTAGTVNVLNGATMIVVPTWMNDGQILIDQSTLITNANFNIGDASMASMIVTGSSAQWNAVSLRLGVGNSGTGEILVSGGAKLNATQGGINIGILGTGSLILDGVGTELLYGMSGGPGIFLGSNGIPPGGNGNMVIRNGAAVHMNAGRIVVGHNGIGSLVIDGIGSSLDRISGGDITLADQPNSQGILEIRNGASLTHTGNEVIIGHRGPATMIVDGVGSSAVFNFPASDFFELGRSFDGEGTLTVSGGATVDVIGDIVRIGPVGIGHINVTGIGSSFTSQITIRLMQGDIHVDAGGTLVSQASLDINGTELVVDGIGSMVVCDGNVLDVQSSLSVTNGAVVTGTTIFRNRGTCSVTNGIIQIVGGGINDGLMQLMDSTFEVTDLFTVTGQIDFGSSNITVPTMTLDTNAYLREIALGANTVRLTGNLVIQSKQHELWDTSTSTLQFDGGDGASQSLEASGRDIGSVTAGYYQNYAIGILEVGPTATTLSLVDDADNRIGVEAVYVNDLVLHAGTTLRLNGINLYYVNLTNSGGKVISGGGQLVPVTLCSISSGMDCNENTVPDDCDISEGFSQDADNDTVPDECGDCNGNGIGDYLDVATGFSTDCNVNQLPDDCEIIAGTASDCNTNLVPDQCDVNLFASGQLFWVSAGFDAIRRADLDGNQVETIISKVQLANSVITDSENGWLFWSEAFPHNDLWRSTIDGAGIEQIVPGAGEPRALAVDGQGSIYWTSSNSVRRANIDGGGATILISGLTDTQGIVIDKVNEKVYWNDKSLRTISRANLDGSSLQTIITSQDNMDRALSLDLRLGKLFWTATPPGGGTSAPRIIRRANLDGTNIEEIVAGLDTQNTLAVDSLGRKLYWSDRFSNRIRRSNLDGSGVEDVITTGLDDPAMITISDFIGSTDCNGNLLPDECEPDCNTNELSDSCETINGLSPDCNLNFLPDSCDLESGFSKDTDLNGLPDECQCPPSAPLPAESNVMKNRFFSLRSGNEGQQTAWRVTFDNLQLPFNVLNGQTMWVGQPQEICENSGQNASVPISECGPAIGLPIIPGDPGPTFFIASLQCDPFFMDWSTITKPININSEFIVPSGTYSIQAVDQLCSLVDETNFSDPLVITNSIWGDVVGLSCLTSDTCSPPDGAVGITSDVSAVLEMFKNTNFAPGKARSDVEPSVLDFKINFTDVTVVLDAFSSKPYPFVPSTTNPCPQP